MAEFILEVDQVEFSYPDGTKVLNKISLAVERGRKVAVLGPNGAGKSTLFLHLNGILQPRRGRIRFMGQDVRYNNSYLKELRQNVGIIFQNPETQLFSASVLQEISFGPLNLGIQEEQVLQRVHRAMADTEIVHLKDKPTHFLSYGQKKRVSIADILAMDPQVLIFDEPTACLEAKFALHILELLDRLNQQGKTIILSTHDLDMAYSWADYIFVVSRGQVIGEGPPQKVFFNDILLQQADLTRPWLVDLYRLLVADKWLPANSPVPKNKQELFKLISQTGLQPGLQPGLKGVCP